MVLNEITKAENVDGKDTSGPSPQNLQSLEVGGRGGTNQEPGGSNKGAVRKTQERI